MTSNMFKVSSGLGRYQFTKSSRLSTPTNSMKTASSSKTPSSNSSSIASKSSRQSNIYVKSDQEIIKQNNNELSMLKDNYMKLRDQYQKEKENYINKLMNLQNELNSEQKRVRNLQSQLENLTSNNKIQDFYQTNGKSIAVVENIWELMQSYRDAIHENLEIKHKVEGDEKTNFLSIDQVILENDDPNNVFSFNGNPNEYQHVNDAKKLKEKASKRRKY